MSELSQSFKKHPSDILVLRSTILDKNLSGSEKDILTLLFNYGKGEHSFIFDYQSFLEKYGKDSRIVRDCIQSLSQKKYIQCNPCTILNEDICYHSIKITILRMGAEL